MCVDPDAAHASRAEISVLAVLATAWDDLRRDCGRPTSP